MAEGGLTLLRVVSNADLVKAEQEEQTAAELAERQEQPFLKGLVAHMKTEFDRARDAKRPIERRMLTALRQRNGEYEPDKLGQIQNFGGSDVFMMLTEVKCRAAESWLRDILLEDDTGPPWISPQHLFQNSHLK